MVKMALVERYRRGIAEAKCKKMIELTVKTLDSKNHAFSVPDDTTVKQLKERIADSVNIPAESQRLIYCGRVLQDDKNLSEYDVNGKVIHLVQRAPPVSNGSGPDRGPSTTRASNGAGGNRRTQQWRSLFGPGGNSGNAMYVGAMAFPAEIMDASGISMQQPRQCLSQSRLAVARTMLNRATLTLNRLENLPQDSSDTSPENGHGSTSAGAEEAAATTSVPIQVEIAAVLDTQGPVEGPSVEVQTEPSTEQTAAANDNEPAQSTSSDQQSPQNETEDEANSNARSPRTRALAELMEQVADINARAQPYMAQYRQLMLDDPAFSSQAEGTANQRLFNGVSEVMHILAHAYHALSDIMCDLSQPPPRHLRCRPVLIHHSAVVQTDIPIQVSANLGATSAASTQQTVGSGSTAVGEERTSQPQPAAAASAPSASEEQAASASASPSSSASTAATPQPSTTPASSNTPGFASPLRITRIGPGAPGLEFFVDVAPSGSIMIDSVEAHVVTNAPPGTASAGADGNTSQNPPEFVQNLITALAGQFMGATLQQYQTQQQQQQQQQAASSSSQTSSSGSSPPQAGGGPAAPAAAQNSQARSNTATHPTTATQTRSTARPHVHLSPAIHAMRANSFDPFLPCNSHHLHSQRGSRAARRAQPQSASGGAPGSARETLIPIPSGNGISIQLRAEPVLNVIAEPSPPRSGGTVGGGGATPRQVPRAVVPPHMPPEVQAIYQAIRNPNTPSTLAQLLQNVPGYSYTPGESIFTDIFMTLAQSLSFLDMVQLGLGNSECLVRARPQLRELISQRLLNNQPLTISAITQIIDRFNNELRPYYTIFDNARLREEVDLPASINLYNHSMLPSILNTVMEEGQNTFHRTLMRKCSLYVRQLCALLLYCCLDGSSGLETIIRSFVNQMTTGVPGFLQEWTVSHSVVNFRTFVSSLNVPAEDIKRFLVYRVGNPATSPQPATTPPPVPPAAEPMDVQEAEEVSTEVVSAPTLMREPPIADVPPTQHINPVVGWQSTLPSDWVPIITRDSQRQRRQNPQGPFSDAYLSGMPSKRRKLITSAKPQGNLSQVISESMAVALGSAGMSSGPEVDVIAARAGQDRNLRTAYREQVRATLRHNLSSNPDYTTNPDQYPNTAKYFNEQ